MKHYLELEDSNGRAVFIAMEDITVITDNGGKMSSILCQGLPGAITVRKSHFEIIKTMTEKKAFELIKFD